MRIHRALSYTAMCLLAVGGVCPATSPAQDDGLPSPREHERAAAFLEATIQRYYVPRRQGLKSFVADLRMRRSDNEFLGRILDSLRVEYRWKAPDKEEIEVSGVLEGLRALVQAPLEGLWKDVTGGGVFPDTEGKTLSLEKSDGEIVLHLFAEGERRGRVFFEAESGKVVRVKLGKSGNATSIVPTYATATGNKLRLEKKRLVTLAGEEEKTHLTHTYGGFRQLSGHDLPTQLVIETANDTFEFQVDYTRINGSVPAKAVVDREAVRALIKNYEKHYSKWTAEQKLKALAELEETEDESAAKAIAGKGLRDSDVQVRKESIAALGAMKCRNVVPSLTRILKPHEKELDVYLEIVLALGNIGDPRAVRSLSRDFWNQRGTVNTIRAAQAKIDALGRIKSKKSVDALIGLLTVAHPWAMRTVAPNLQNALKKLTGRDFGWDVKQWKKWWRENKSRFKLEEDRSRR